MAGALSACTLGPDFMRPANITAEESAQYINAPQSENTAVDTQTMAHWWERLDDPLMNDYVAQLLSENLELRQAAERVIQSRAALRQAGAAAYPSLSASADAARRFTPSDSFGDTTLPNGAAGAFGSGSDRRYTTSYNADLSASWEIDLFGRIARSREAAKANFEASQYDREALTHSLIAELFNTRIAIAVNAELLKLARQTVKNRNNFYDLVKNRYDLGTASVGASDVYLARQNLTNAKSDVSRYERALSEQSYALDVLLGLKPGTTNAAAEDFDMVPPPLDVPVCLPADLLDRRPDLRASELRYKAANADIGVAIADLYPSVSLGGSLGVTGDTTNDLFTAQNLAGSLMASITQRIFEGGALRANIDLQESEARELAAAYSQNILEAVRDVETALKAEKELARELKNIQASARDLKNAQDISRDRFGRGIESFQNYLDIEQSRYSAQQNLILKKQEKWNARTALYLALGGDWFSDENTAMNSCTQNAQKGTEAISHER